MHTLISYFSEVKAELQKVTWPTKEQTIEKTWLVIGVSIVVAAYLGALDVVFQKLIEWMMQIS